MNNKKNMLCLAILVFGMFLPHVYASSFEVKLRADKTSGVVVGTTSEVIMSLDNIKVDDSGISACLFDIKTSGGVSINSSIRSFGSWSYTPGTHNMVDTFDSIKGSSDVIAIPVKIDGNGNLTISNITCSTETEDDVETADKMLTFTVLEANSSSSSNNSSGNSGSNNNNNNNTGNNNSGSNSNLDQGSSNLSSDCDLTGIEVNGSSLNFDPNTLEYVAYVPDLISFVITPFASSDKATFDISEEEINSSRKKVMIKVTAENGMTKNYTLYLTNVLDEVVDKNEDSNSVNGNSFDYKFIFIGLIVLLVLVNIFRIVMKKKKQNIEN